MQFRRKYYDCKTAKCIVKFANLCVIVPIVSNLLFVITNYYTTGKKLKIRRNILRSSIFYRIFIIRLDVI